MENQDTLAYIVRLILIKRNIKGHNDFVRYAPTETKGKESNAPQKQQAGRIIAVRTGQTAPTAEVKPVIARPEIQRTARRLPR